MGHETQVPTKFIAFSFLAIMLVMIGLGYQVLNSYADIQRVQSHSIRLQQLSDQIIYLDEVLTMSTKMAAATSDRAWHDRYLAHVARLDEALSEIQDKATAVHHEWAAKTVDANRHLVEVEQRAFELVWEGEAAEAQTLLASDDYSKHKQRYLAGMNGLLDDLSRVAAEETSRYQRAVLVAGVQIVIAIPLILFVWSRSTNMLKQYRETHEQDQAQLRSAKDLAEDASAAKSRFLANMSHEIRTPLNAVIGLASIGVRDHHGQKCGKTFEQIRDSGQHLLGVINEILDYSKIEAGKLKIDLRPTQLIPVVEYAFDVIVEQAKSKGLTASLDLQNELPHWVEADSLRLQQVLLNLLSNAVKFTEQGGVSLRVYPDGGDICFLVADTGVGMDEDRLSSLFQPFEQADAGTTRQFGGTGLGLAISRDLARLMGGEIAAVSEPGNGSRFTLRLPLQVAPAVESVDMKTVEAKDHKALRGLRVLAAEDVEINRLILEDLLTAEGADVRFAVDGQQAIDRIEESGANCFDVVLMDVQMPRVDGHEATRRILQLVPGLPVIGLTAHALAEEREKCLASGMVDHVTKPIDPEVLVAAVLKHARGWPESIATGNRLRASVSDERP